MRPLSPTEEERCAHANAAGIQISRAPLTNYVRWSIELFAPIYEAQRTHVLQSRVVCVDVTPINAGRKKAKKPKKRGQMKTTWCWPIHGEEKEVYFSWSPTVAPPTSERNCGVHGRVAHRRLSGL